MKDALPKEIRLDDYLAPNYLIDTTQLHFELGEAGTLVKSTLKMRLNPDAQNVHAKASKPEPLELHGVDLELKRIAIDGKNLQPGEYEVNGELLTITSVPDAFQLECVTLLRPQLNTSLEGLYKSNTMFCTQCEAEGFRKITYYLDRPDVMSIFTTTISADKEKYPVLLSNGNDIERGESGQRHWVTWHDPFKKPAYLFALVAGNLVHQEDSFTTLSGRAIQLQIFVEKENYDKCDHAMASLKHAMKWDEDVYGREYDLDKFMIVAVNDFNMGAMENKGLNIFNSSCVLAKPETATDFAYQRIEGVVAHEYFHNWSGNRVTCRDWFQLSLKEGFTVFRDQEFSADMGSRAVKRIDDVSQLRTVQFAQDAGPMAHPVRPAAYLEISNFYTVTIYEKGAEVVRMIRTLLGKEHFRKGCDLYFQRHDGQAVTTDDFVAAMESASGVDLTQFKRWYSQAGTPVLTVSNRYDEASKQFHLDVEQYTPDTPGQTGKPPLHIPLAIGLLDSDGNELVSEVLELKGAKQTFVFEGMDEKPVPSLLRGFSAPVKLNYPYTTDELVFLTRYDQDGFNRWNAAQTLALNIIQKNAVAYRSGQPMVVDLKLIASYRFLLGNPDLDKAMLARMLMMPSEAYLAELAEQIDVEAIHVARQYVRKQMATELREELLTCYKSNQFDGTYAFNADAVAQRSLKNTCLHYLMLLDEKQILEISLSQFQSSSNMTDTSSALSAIVHSGFMDEKERVLADFYQQWRHDPLVVDQWFSVQASNPLPESFAQVQELLNHPAFDIKNPNKVRSLVGVFCHQNAINFHREDGAGYVFLADKIIELDKINPQIAARLVTPLTTWRRYLPECGQKMQAQLERIKARQNLSKDVFEVVSKSL